MYMYTCMLRSRLGMLSSCAFGSHEVEIGEDGAVHCLAMEVWKRVLGVLCSLKDLECRVWKSRALNEASG